MTPRMTVRRWRGAATLLTTAVAALTVAACGSSSTSSSSSASSQSSASAQTTASSQSTSAPASAGSASAAPASWIAYTGGKAGAANPSLAPVEIGFVNDQGGSTVIAGTDPTTGAQLAVNWINKYAGGIGGHPLKLVTCFVKNAEAEGQTCAQQFLADPKISVISYGAMALGASAIDSTVAGRKPIVIGVSINPPDLKTKNTYILDAAVPYLDYPWAQYAKQYLHASSAAVLYPNQTGQLEVMQAVQQALKASGIKSKLVAMDPNSSDVTGALVAAGATSAGAITANVATPSQCLAFANSAQKLGIDPGKIIGLPQCDIPGIKSQYPGGDFPKWNYVTAFPVIYEHNAIGTQYQSVFKALGGTSVAFDPLSTVDFSDVLTLAKWMNTIGYSKISPATIEAQAKSFKGPILLGPSSLSCGKYPSAPSVCSDGVGVLKYTGNGNYSVVAPWVETPPALQKQLGAKYVTQ